MHVSIRNGRRLHCLEQARALTSVRKRKKILSLERTGCDATRSRKFSRPTLRRSTKSGSRLSADSLCHTNSAYKRHNSRSKIKDEGVFYNQEETESKLSKIH